MCVCVCVCVCVRACSFHSYRWPRPHSVCSVLYSSSLYAVYVCSLLNINTSSFHLLSTLSLRSLSDHEHVLYSSSLYAVYVILSRADHEHVLYAFSLYAPYVTMNTSPIRPLSTLFI